MTNPSSYVHQVEDELRAQRADTRGDAGHGRVNAPSNCWGLQGRRLWSLEIRQRALGTGPPAGPPVQGSSWGSKDCSAPEHGGIGRQSSSRAALVCGAGSSDGAAASTQGGGGIARSSPSQPVSAVLFLLQRVVILLPGVHSLMD